MRNFANTNVAKYLFIWALILFLTADTNISNSSSFLNLSLFAHSLEMGGVDGVDLESLLAQYDLAGWWNELFEEKMQNN